jgi:hypothetical protein
MKTRKNKNNKLMKMDKLEKELLDKPLELDRVQIYLNNRSKFSSTVSNKIEKYFVNEFLKTVAYGPSIQTIELADLLLKLN